MKIQNYLLTTLLTLGLINPVQAMISDETIQSRIPADLIINQDYGSPNDVELTVSGIFSNGCFSKLQTEGIIADNVILIDNLISFQTNSHCTMNLMPYMDSIKIHDLRPGTYQIYVKNRSNDYKAIDSFKIDQ